MKTFTARETVIRIYPTSGSSANPIIVGVFQGGEFEVSEDLLEIFTTGQWQPTDIKEDVHHIKGTLRRGVVRDAGGQTASQDLLDQILRSANGYLPLIDIEFKVVDGTGTTPYNNRVVTITGCKAENWKETYPNRGAIVVGELRVMGTDLTRVNGTQATYPNPLT